MHNGILSPAEEDTCTVPLLRSMMYVSPSAAKREGLYILYQPLVHKYGGEFTCQVKRYSNKKSRSLLS